MNRERKILIYPPGTSVLDVEEWKDEINTEANAGIDLSKVRYDGYIPIWWKCPKCNSTYKAYPFVRTKGSICSYCTKKKINETNNFFAEKPEAANYWDWDMNTIDPNKITSGTEKVAHFRCPKCNHRYQMTVRAWSSYKEPCPYCRDTATSICRYEDSIAHLYPEIVQDWSFEKNEMDPAHIGRESGKEVYWYCHLCGKEWKAKINTRIRGQRKCPKCKGWKQNE